MGCAKEYEYGVEPLVDVAGGETQEDSNLTEQFKGEGELASLTFKYPSTWKNEGTAQSEIEGVNMNMNMLSSFENGALITIEVYGGTIMEGVDFETYFDQVSSGLKEGVKLIDEEATEEYAEPNGCKVYTYNTYTDSGYGGMYATMHYIVKGDKYYNISIGSIVSSREEGIEIANKYKSIVNTINID